MQRKSYWPNSMRKNRYPHLESIFYWLQVFKELLKKVGMPWELIENYSKDSTIHGMKYVGEKQRHWSSKLFWIAIFVISVFFCTKNIIEIYRVRQERPVMISFAKKLASTFEIPFAAVTICPEMKAPCDKVNVTEILSRKNRTFSGEEIQSLGALSHVCDSHAFDEDIQRATASGTMERFNVVKKLNELSHSSDDVFHKCRFGTWKHENCGKYFHKVITDVGVCYTFNMLDYKDFVNNETMHTELHYPAHGKPSNWFLHKDYESMKVKVYPRRVPGAGLQSGLSVHFKMDLSKLCSSCTFTSHGFRVALHMPVELPSLSKQFYNIPLRRETNLIVKPNMIYASKDIKNYEPASRQCYFNGERQLKFYKIYSKTNCESECKADYVSSQCGCIKFYMPRSNETAVCNSTQLVCAYQAELNYTTRDLQRKLLEKQLKRDVKHGKAGRKDPRYEELKKLGSCNCLASCASIKYDVEISQTDNDSAEDDFITAILNVYFKDSHFSRLKRYEIYGWSDFLSNSGGTLGLFLGCSVLSFIEIIYHVIVYFIRRIHNKVNPEILPNQ